MNPIDRFLNGITMYRLVLYCLLGITGVAFALAGAGILGYPIASLAGSLAVLVVTGYIAHILLRRAFGSATSIESWIITILILFLILKPAGTMAEYSVLVVGAVLAIASKYIFALQNRHIFNPAAIALVVLGLLGSGEVFWWVGSKALLPVVLIAGLLIVRKTKRFHMVLTFVVVALVVSAIVRGDSLTASTLIRDVILSGPLVFFAAVMLTEPSTIPATGKDRLIFAALVGAIYGVYFDIGPLYSSPELALIVGNLFAYAVNSKQRLRLTLKAVTKLSPAVYEFAFTPDRP
ncbi:MAG TPA: RnfABCDGE type electron transport complex subunit D, partial [Candidatus Limnocylindrales bacterium]|nr:RnfABCDGE type electron transport complex subunit D [Candidatus Limnocylindrales bacterium]